MIDLKQYGYIETETESPSDRLLPGRVTEHRGAQYTVITERGELSAVLKGAFVWDAVIRDDLPCVGDFVLLQYNELGESLITKLLPRRSKFSRFDAFGHGYAHIKANREQIVAANFDYVFIMTSLNKDFKVNRIARYLTQTRQSGGQPVVILTKADLIENFTSALAEVKIAAPDVPVHAVSAYTGYGMDELGEYLQPEKTVVFLGMSGVGKSSLLNALINQEVMAVKAIREDDSRGRHTTTHRQLFMLPPLAGASSGAMVIDTPGMRELGLFGADEGISVGFNDVEDLFTGCRFTNCRHITEPGCAVLAALADGSLPREHWERYLAQKQENKFVDDKSGYLQDKRAWHKDLAKWSKQQKKSGRIRK
jgi:ribosome biogenesis GTPase